MQRHLIVRKGVQRPGIGIYSAIFSPIEIGNEPYAETAGAAAKIENRCRWRDPELFGHLEIIASNEPGPSVVVMMRFLEQRIDVDLAFFLAPVLFRELPF